MTTQSNSRDSAVLLVGRILLAALFLVSAITKVMAPEAIQGYIASVGLPFPALLFYVTVVFEITAALLLVIGFRIPLVALALAGFSVATALVFHHSLGNPNELAHFLKNLAVAGGLLQLVPARRSLNVAAGRS